MVKMAICIGVMGILTITSNVVSQINFKANDISFRDYNNAAKATYHYGDFHCYGGSSGTQWGWLSCNAFFQEASDKNNNFYGPLNVYNNFNVSGGTKNFVQPHPTDSTKEIVYTCIEAGEALTIARGVASTVHGQITIALPEHYTLVTSSERPVSVIITPEGKPAMLYVSSKSKQAVTIAVKQEDYNQYGDVSFSYQVTGVRDGFEDHEPIQDVFNKKPVSEKQAAIINKCRAIADKKMAIERKEKEKIVSETNGEDE